MDYNNKTTIAREKSYGDVFKKQGNEFNKYQEDIKHNVIQHNPDIFHKIPRETTATKKKRSYNGILEGFESIFNDPGLGISNHTLDKTGPNTEPTTLFNNPTNAPPSDSAITNYINKSQSEIDKTQKLMNITTNIIKDPGVNNLQKQFNAGLTDYENTNAQFLGNTANYLTTENKKNNVDQNVYVNKMFNQKEAQFIGLFNDNPQNPAMSILDGDYNYDTCNDVAFNLGKPYFGLQQANTTTNMAKCAVGDDASGNYAEYGVYQPKCVTANDGSVYGGANANAIYSLGTSGTTPNYLGCYKDGNTRAMSSTGDLSTNNGIYLPVYIAGAFGDSPWGTSNYPDTTASWIWYTENAASDAPYITEPVYFLYVFDYTCGTTGTSCNYTTANIYGMCDNGCSITVNGSSTDLNGTSMTISGGWGGEGNTGFVVSINPGNNIIEVLATNAGGPAGLLLSFIDQTTSSLLFNTNSKWYYSTKVSSYTTRNAQTFSADTCAQYAHQFGYQYFGLQNIISGQAGTAQCFLSNDLTTAQRYGSLGGETSINGTKYGLNNVNAVYEMNNPGDPSAMGQIGYVDSNNKLSIYPSSMISPGTTYDQLQNYDSPGNDITKVAGTTSSNCMSICNSDANCSGFIFDNSGATCWTKTTKMYGPTNLDGPIQSHANYDIYMREPQITNNSSCPVSVNNISSVEWDAYQQSGTAMSASSLCKLKSANETVLKARVKSNQKLSGLTGRVYDGIMRFMNLNQVMNNQMDQDKNIMDTNLSMYKTISEKYNNTINNNVGNINNILTDSQISVLQLNYFYILWIILALVIFALCIYFIRKVSIPTNNTV